GVGCAMVVRVGVAGSVRGEVDGLSRWRGFFFFKAEEGIRCWSVIGVQTCALPISGQADRSAGAARARRGGAAAPAAAASASASRSEERRVGKECRQRGAPDEYKKRTYQP